MVDAGVAKPAGDADLTSPNPSGRRLAARRKRVRSLLRPSLVCLLACPCLRCPKSPTSLWVLCLFLCPSSTSPLSLFLFLWAVDRSSNRRSPRSVSLAMILFLRPFRPSAHAFARRGEREVARHCPARRCTPPDVGLSATPVLSMRRWPSCDLPGRLPVPPDARRGVSRELEQALPAPGNLSRGHPGWASGPAENKSAVSVFGLAVLRSGDPCR